MSRSPRQALWILTLTIAGLVAGGPPLHGQRNTPTQRWQILEREPGTTTTADGRLAYPVRVHFDQLAQAAAAGGIIELPLTDTVTVEATVQWVRLDASQTFVAGPLVGSQEGEVSLTAAGETLVGRVRVNDRLFMVRRAPDRPVHLVTEIDQQSLPPEAPPLSPPGPPGATTAPRPEPGRADSGAVVDVMVLYTPAARTAAGGTAQIGAEVTGAINNANLALANAGVTFRFRLAHSSEIAYTETNDSVLDLTRLRTAGDGFLDGVHALRNQYGADTVTLLTTDSDACGLGYLMTSTSVQPWFEAYAFNVVYWICANANLTTAHETGHNMGLEHDRANAGASAPSRPYAYGYRVPGLARDVMSYECSPSCPRRAIFSTPLYNFPGTTTVAGTATEDNARALNDNRMLVANFRQSVRTTNGDFDGDGRADFTVFRPGGGMWVVHNQAGASWGGTGDIPVPGDYNGDRRMDFAVFRPSSGTWFVQGQSGVAFGGAGDIPVPADYNGDGTTDLAVFRPSNGTWFILGQPAVSFGAAGDIPVPGDYSGVGHAEIAVYRRGAWYVLGQAGVNWGAVGDLPVPADYNGDGMTDMAVFRPANGSWFVRNQFAVGFGAAGDVPVPQDLTGDGQVELVVYRPTTATWYSYDVDTGTGTAQMLGAVGDLPALAAWLRHTTGGDLEGDRRADLTLFRPSDGTWRSRLSSTGLASGPTQGWGASGDVPVPGDYLGTRTIQRAVFRNGAWFIQGGPTIVWGTTGDVPVEADYDGDSRTDVGVFRNGAWYILYSSTNFSTSGTVLWGTAGDVPVPADYDGDNKADFTVFRNGAWFILLSASNYTSSRTVVWGTGGDIPVAGNYDGDGFCDVAVFRPSDGAWYIQRSSDGTMEVHVFGGVGGDVPVPGDFDGDRRTDVAIFRGSTSTWYVLGQFSLPFGSAGDVPVGNGY